MKNFIGGYQLIDTSLCDELIEYHKNNIYDKTPGYTANKELGTHINEDVKSSLDVSININSNHPTIKKYFIHLNECLDSYKQEYEYCFSNLFTNESPNIQYYSPGGGFKIWHYERNFRSLTSMSRALVYMTYLNDVPDGGTEFLYQEFKTEAKKGLTLIWPAEWTHTHKGIVSPDKEKYIITGWFNLSM